MSRVLIMAGGTGGHVYPALAIAKKLQEQQDRVFWLGSIGGMEEVVRNIARHQLRSGQGTTRIITLDRLFRNTDEDHLSKFVYYLADRGVQVNVRRSRGKDIDAACGQLVGQFEDRTRRAERHLAAFAAAQPVTVQ